MHRSYIFELEAKIQDYNRFVASEYACRVNAETLRREAKTKKRQGIEYRNLLVFAASEERCARGYRLSSQKCEEEIAHIESYLSNM